MGTRETWGYLSARIRGLIEASGVAASLVRPGRDAYAVFNDLAAHVSAIRSDLLAFERDLSIAEPHAAEAIKRVAAKIAPLLVDSSGSRDLHDIQVRTAIVMVAALEGEISYLLRDQSEATRLRTELAFEHLNRSIVVDQDIREKWKKAFAAGEVACEKLGAVHLLSHGIWAFKAHGAGARTDLVYQEPLADSDKIARIADGLVLTEWKKLPDKDDADALFTAARNQAELYAVGILGGTELKRYRYVIVVSSKTVTVPDDNNINGVVYRNINIVVDPDTPSQAAKP